jgi:hypothetical protein
LFEFVVGTFNYKELGLILTNQKLENSSDSLVSEEILPTTVQHNTTLEIV